jgi:hypothetical protein
MIGLQEKTCGISGRSIHSSLSSEGLSPTSMYLRGMNNFLGGVSGPYPNKRITWNKNDDKDPNIHIL